MRKFSKHKVLVSVIAAMIVLFLCGMSYGEELRVGVDTAFVPFEFKGKDGK